MTPLRQRMIEDMQVRNLALNTQRSYLEQVSRFARHFNKSPEQLGSEDIRAYQVYLTNEKKLAPSSVVTAVAALRFVYKVSLKKNWQVRVWSFPVEAFSSRTDFRRPAMEANAALISPRHRCD
jgi:site-specific recombinase XerD